MLDTYKTITPAEASILSMDYKEIMYTETHHNHKLVMVDDVLRWEEDIAAVENAFIKAFNFDKAVAILFEYSLIDEFQKESLISNRNIEELKPFASKIDLNQIAMLFNSIGVFKNHELYRELYRNLGYSLSGYWEIFYWDANNDEAASYVPQEILDNYHHLEISA